MRSKEIERSLKNWINVPAILIPYIIYSFIGYIPETNAQNINKNLYGFLGGEVQFNCNYTDSDDSIISIDWFFSRDTASIGVPILTVNPHESVQINSQWNDRIAFHDPTTNTSFTLKNLKEGDQGIYRCTVIGDNTITHDQYLEVYDPPDEQEGLKVIEDFKPLAVGETMIYTCQSSNSKPATKLTWMINDAPVDNDMVKLNLTLTDPGSGASTSVLKILMVGSNELNGAKLTCKATLPNQSVKEWTKMIQITHSEFAMRNKSFSDLNMMIAAGGPRDVSVTAPMRSDMAGDTTKKPSSGTSLILGHNFNHVYWLTILMIAIARILV